MTSLHQLECIPCHKGEPPLEATEVKALKQELPAWQLVEREGVPHLERTFTFKDFAQALAFTNKVGELAEAANHHPEITLTWGKVTVAWWTHVAHGLHRNDFIMAARTDQAYA